MIAWLVRIRFGDYTTESENDFRRACSNVHRLAPEVWAQIRFHSRLETRKLAKQQKIPASYLGADIVRTIGVPGAILDAATRYGEKLAKALHYLHTSTISPSTAVVKCRVFTNAEALATEFLDRFLLIATGEPVIRHAQTSLSDQFNYRYVVIADGTASAFVVRFGDGVVFVLALFRDRERYEESRNRRTFESPDQAAQ